MILELIHRVMGSLHPQSGQIQHGQSAVGQPRKTRSGETWWDPSDGDSAMTAALPDILSLRQTSPERRLCSVLACRSTRATAPYGTGRVILATVAQRPSPSPNPSPNPNPSPPLRPTCQTARDLSPSRDVPHGIRAEKVAGICGSIGSPVEPTRDTIFLVGTWARKTEARNSA